MAGTLKVGGVTLATHSDSDTNVALQNMVLPNGATLRQSSIVTTNGAASYNITIPSGVKYITAMVIDITATGDNSSGQASDFVFRLGTSTGLKTSGYKSSGGYVGPGSAIEADTTGFKIYNNTTSSTIQNFIADFYLFDSTRWVMKGQGNYVTAATQYFTQSAGSVTLDGSVTTISLVSVSATSQTFDGGEFRIMYA